MKDPWLLQGIAPLPSWRNYCDSHSFHK